MYFLNISNAFTIPLFTLSVFFSFNHPLTVKSAGKEIYDDQVMVYPLKYNDFPSGIIDVQGYKYNNRIDCKGTYSPSACNGDDCTTDEVYRDCQYNWQRVNCLESGGSWEKRTETGLTNLYWCVCPEGTELNIQHQCI